MAYSASHGHTLASCARNHAQVFAKPTTTLLRVGGSDTRGLAIRILEEACQGQSTQERKGYRVIMTMGHSPTIFCHPLYLLVMMETSSPTRRMSCASSVLAAILHFFC